MKRPICNYCNRPAVFVGGNLIYPGRPDLAHLNFWACGPCRAYVGCHRAGTYQTTEDGTRRYSHGAEPLGTLANHRLRYLRGAAHDAIDWMWRGAENKPAARQKVYERLAGQMGIPVSACHIGQFDEQQCLRAIHLGARHG